MPFTFTHNCRLLFMLTLLTRFFGVFLFAVFIYIFSQTSIISNGRYFVKYYFLTPQKQLLTDELFWCIIPAQRLEIYSGFEKKFLTESLLFRIILILRWKYQSENGEDYDGDCYIYILSHRVWLNKLPLRQTGRYRNNDRALSRSGNARGRE